MKEFDYIIIGGGCAGLSLAYELDIHQKLKDKIKLFNNVEIKFMENKGYGAAINFARKFVKPNFFFFRPSFSRFSIRFLILILLKFS